MAGASPTEAPPGGPPALGVAPPLRPAARGSVPRPPAGQGALRRGAWIATLLLAALICAVTFYSKGGLTLETVTTTEMVLTIGSGVLLAAAALVARADTPLYGLWPALLLLAFALLTGLSILWSVQPDASWRDANRLLAYAAVFAAAIALARLGPRHWPALLGGVALSSVVICGYALLAKSMPGQFSEANHYARLYEPFGYWNALGLTAAMGAVCCVWLGARRAGHALLSALAYPALGVLLLTLLLAYSRGALAALAIGLVLWFCLVPLRLRGAAVLLCAGACAGAIAAWDFHDHALSSEGVPIAEAASGGHELGALVIVMILALSAAGVAITFATGRSAPTALVRRRAGFALIGAIGVCVLAVLGALAASHRGFEGTISHDLHTLTDTHAKVPNTPGRLTAIASVRAQYWDEALKVFTHHVPVGVGASGYEVARLRYRTGPLPVKHAHGFVVQTLADLGIAGLVLALALLLCWMAAVGRPTHPFDRRWRSWRELRAGRRPAWVRLPVRRYGAERIGMLSVLCVVVVFGVHSLIDWTWYVPGNALVALICAGWLAGRGPLRPAAEAPILAPGPAEADGAATGNGAPEGRALGEEEAPGAPAQRADGAPGVQEAPDAAARPRRLLAAAEHAGWVRMTLAAALLVTALLAAWSQWQPQRAEDAREQALGLLAGSPVAARTAAEASVSRDPLSAEALIALAEVQSSTGQRAAARVTLQRAVRLQPSNPQTWLTLGAYDLPTDPRAALQELRAGIYLDPELISPEALATGAPGQQEAVQVYNEYVQALRASTAAAAPARAAQHAASATLTSASARRAREARRLSRKARRQRERRLRQSRSRG